MANTTPHSDHDPNSKLARELGRHLEGQADTGFSSEGDEPFVELLLAYRDGVRSERQVPNSQSDRLWKRISGSISSPTIVRLTSIRVVGRWAAGIAAAVALLVGLYSWFGGSEEELLASTTSDVETIALTDGSSVTLRPYSSLSVIDRGNHLYRLEGEALFDVKHDPNREFVVETEFASVAVLGTRFDVSTWADETQVYLVRGSVRVARSESSETTVLEPGQAVVINRNMITGALSEASGSTYTDWMKGELSFDQSPTYRVAAELGHHFNVTLIVPLELENETLSGRILLTSLDQGLEDLSTVLGGHFEPTGSDSFVLVPN